MQPDVNQVPALHSPPGYNFFWEYLLGVRGRQQRNVLDHKHSEFLTYCLANYPESRAQLFQDFYVLCRLSLKTAGYFVEFGATDGLTISNTHVLEKLMGWTGILAEPFPVWHDALAANRGCIIDTRCVWEKSGEQLRFLGTRNEPELATLESFRDCDNHKGTRAKDPSIFTVETVSLNDLLDRNSAPKVIDYLSVDTEGSEYTILKAFDFEAHRPRIITVEHNYMEGPREQIRMLLHAQGYVREFEDLSRWDDWYYHRDLVKP